MKCAAKVDTLSQELQSSKYDFISHARFLQEKVQHALRNACVRTEAYFGPLLELMKVKPDAREYMKAISYFLDSVWDIHVVDGLETVQRVQHVAPHVRRIWNLGKFPPRNRGQKRLPPQLASKVVDPRTLVQFPDKIVPIVDFIFGRMLIVPDDRVASILLRECNIPSISVAGNVTRSGEFHGGFSGTASSTTTKTTKVANYHRSLLQLSKLERDMVSCQAKCQTRSTLLGHLRRRKQLEQQAADSTAQLSKWTSALMEFAVTRSRYQGQCDVIVSQIQHLHATGQESFARKSKLLRDALIVKSRQVTSEATVLEQKIRVLELQREDSKLDSTEEKVAELGQCASKLGSLTVRRKEVNDAIVALDKRKECLQTRSDALSMQMTTIADEISAVQKQIDHHVAAISKLTVDAELCEGGYIVLECNNGESLEDTERLLGDKREQLNSTENTLEAFRQSLKDLEPSRFGDINQTVDRLNTDLNEAEVRVMDRVNYYLANRARLSFIAVQGKCAHDWESNQVS